MGGKKGGGRHVVHEDISSRGKKKDPSRNKKR